MIWNPIVPSAVMANAAQSRLLARAPRIVEVTMFAGALGDAIASARGGSR